MTMPIIVVKIPGCKLYIVCMQVHMNGLSCMLTSKFKKENKDPEKTTVHKQGEDSDSL